MTEFVESGPPRTGLSFRDPTLPLDHRVDALLRCLTLDEKVAMLHQHAPGVPTLGVDAFRTGTEALHGVAWLGPATVFPQAVGLGATWDPDLLREVGRAVGKEVEAFHRADPTVSRNVWAPVVCLLRDPRWGRNEEGYSEDPVLTSALAIAYCTGLRGPDGGPLTTAPTLKSFLAYNHEDGKLGASAQVRPRVFWEYEARPFLDAIRAGVVSGVMPSYHRVNGRPAHVGPWFGVLRDIDPDLVVFTDASGPSALVERTGYFPDHPRALAAALRSGVDSFTDHNKNPAPTVAGFRAALDTGLLHEDDVDVAVRRLLRMRFQLGEFDGRPDTGPSVEELYGSDEHRALALRAAREAVVLLKNAAVGDTPLLPLGEDVTSVAVVGPLADEVHTDWYSGALPYRRTILDGVRERWPGAEVTFAGGADRVALLVRGHGYLASPPDADGGPLGIDAVDTPDLAHLFDRTDWGEGVVSLRSAANDRLLSVRRVDDVLVNTASWPPGWMVRETFAIEPHDDAFVLWNIATGSYLAAPGPDGPLRFGATTAGAAVHFTLEVHRDGVAAAVEAAAGADVALVTVGNHPHINGKEGEDRPGLELPDQQDRLARAVVAAQRRTVGIVVSSYPFAVPWLAEHAPALLWTCHGGQELGRAVADVLSGDHSPAGRLPQTWYRDEADLPPLADYDIIKSRQTYLYTEATPLFPFGHGLGYGTFEYSSLRIVRTDDAMTVTCAVANTADRAADEVVQLYVRAVDPVVPRPRRELKGFRRVRVEAGATVDVEFTVEDSDLSTWDTASGRYQVTSGRFEVLLGGSSEDIRLTGTVDVVGPDLEPRRLDTRLVRAVDFDDYRATRLVAETALGGDAVEADESGAWLTFRSGEFTTGATSAVARVAGDGPGSVLIRLEDPEDGPVVAETEVVGDGRWRTVQFPAVVPVGRHDVHVVLSKGVRIATFTFTGEQG
ncbi:glycoside hydrolase family 3 C-terminal domain-containing protein [Actinosynnema sp. NPDC050801]|uniref:glycoside hydrolase family 3 C-terminal domain-containing protein n=1 Tax=unclassified Actinosynnema TaxID=2637065 RepID=UPI0033EFBC80